MQKILVAYMPVLHGGYLKLLEEVNPDKVYLLGEDVVNELGIDYIIRKDRIRAISSFRVLSALKGWGWNTYRMDISVASNFLLSVFDGDEIILPDEDISREFSYRYLPDEDVIFSPIFLRWHRDNVAEERQAQAHRTVFLSEFQKDIMRQVLSLASRSFDWWRQTCAFFVKDGNILITARNEHLPDEQAPYAFGDPRAIFKRGVYVELSTSEHAEARVIAEAARRGIPLEGGDIYCTDFPCPPCAKLVARSGIRRLFFQHGYAMLDSETVLKNSGIELIYVDAI